MYNGLGELFWWDGLKGDIVEFVSKYCNLKQVKAEHHNMIALHYEIQIPTWMIEDININFVVGFPRTRKQYVITLVIVIRLTKSALNSRQVYLFIGRV